MLEQAEKDLLPWIARDDEQGQKMWRINQRIVKLMVELMRNHDSPEALIILARASDLLLRARDGMLVDGEMCGFITETSPVVNASISCRGKTSLRKSIFTTKIRFSDGSASLARCASISATMALPARSRYSRVSDAA